jgi:hypothetical protein
MSNLPRKNTAAPAKLCAGALRAPVLLRRRLASIPGALELPGNIPDDGLAQAPPSLRRIGRTDTLPHSNTLRNSRTPIPKRLAVAFTLLLYPQAPQKADPILRTVGSRVIHGGMKWFF